MFVLDTDGALPQCRARVEALASALTGSGTLSDR